MNDVVDSVSNGVSCLQFDAVIHDAVLAAAACQLEGDGILALLHARVRNVGSKEIVPAAVHGTAIDGGIVNAGLPCSPLRAVDLHVDSRAGASTACN